VGGGVEGVLGHEEGPGRNPDAFSDEADAGAPDGSQAENLQPEVKSTATVVPRVFLHGTACLHILK